MSSSYIEGDFCPFVSFRVSVWLLFCLLFVFLFLWFSLLLFLVSCFSYSYYFFFLFVFVTFFVFLFVLDTVFVFLLSLLLSLFSCLSLILFLFSCVSLLLFLFSDSLYNCFCFPVFCLSESVSLSIAVLLPVCPFLFTDQTLNFTDGSGCANPLQFSSLYPLLQVRYSVIFGTWH